MFLDYTGSYSLRIYFLVFASLLIAMMILYKREHKEVMKILLAAFLTSIILNRIDYMCYTFSTFNIANIENPFLADSIRVIITQICSVILSIILPILFVNHFVINYNGKASKYAINVNKFLVFIMTIVTIFDLISLLVVTIITNSLSKLFTIAMYRNLTSNLFPLFYCLTIVSVEAFINNRRAEKELVKSTKKQTKKQTKRTSKKK